MIDSAALTPLSPEDARILALETGRIRGHTLKVLVLDGAPESLQVRALGAAVAERLPEAPRWRQRLVPAPATPTGLAWQDDPEFDIERHVRAVRDTGPVGEERLRRIVADTMVAPLDRARPLWTLDVVPGLTGGRQALVWKVHHCLADGLAIMQAGSRLLWTEETQRVTAHAPPETPGVPGQLRAGVRLATLAGYRGLFFREFRPVKELSPLGAEVGPDRAVAFVTCALEELRALGKAAGPGVTVNDVLLCLVAGAMRRWLLTEGFRSAPMKVQVPVSMHPHLGEDDPCGNRDSFLFVSLPLAEPDPVARLRKVSAATRRRKNRHDARAIFAFRASLAHAPRSLRRRLQRVVQGPYEYSLNVSNVPGPAGPIQVVGHPVVALYSVAEVAPRHALRVAAVSLSGSLNIGLCADPGVVPDLDVLSEGIRLSVEELRERLDGGVV